MKFRALILLVFSLQVYAKIELAPPNFEVNGDQAVWVDFQSAEYKIIYDTNIQRASAGTQITFYQAHHGKPLFDSVSEPLKVLVNGEEVKTTLVSTPNGESVVRMVEKNLPPGHHTLSLTTNIEHGVQFSTPKLRKSYKRVSSAFFIRDLTDRMFLEQYLPTNLEYDSYKMMMDVEVIGTKRWHSLFANGKVTKYSNNHYRVDFPDYYTCSSVYFHLVPINKFVRDYTSYKSIDGREFPVTIYSKFRVYNHFLKKKAFRVLKELENDYGPYPHDQLIIYGTGLKGGMEHAGATETSITALGHELQHFYFAKGIHPANGNSGWLDEAIASWRDKGHQTHDAPFFESSNIGNHTVYTRKTDRRSYEYGRSFMAYLDHELKSAGHPGLKDFLRFYFNKRKFTQIKTQDFIDDLEEYSRMSFSSDFKQYIFGGTNVDIVIEKKHDHIEPETQIENPFHPKRSEAELQSII